MNDAPTIEAPTCLAQAERMRLQIEDAMRAERKRHQQGMDVLERGLASAAAICALYAKSLNYGQLLLAENVIEVEGSFARAGTDREQARSDAIADLLAGAPRLRERYFGTKDYPPFYGQWINPEYGMGPKHGSVVLRIGLTTAARKRLAAGGELTDEEVSAAIYYLRELETIQQANAQGRQSAKQARAAA